MNAEDHARLLKNLWVTYRTRVRLDGAKRAQLLDQIRWFVRIHVKELRAGKQKTRSKLSGGHSTSRSVPTNPIGSLSVGGTDIRWFDASYIEPSQTPQRLGVPERSEGSPAQVRPEADRGGQPTPQLVDLTEWEKTGLAVGKLVASKQLAYGDSFGKAGDVMRILYPTGISHAQMPDALTVVRILDKLFRVATDRDALGESPWSDIEGYANLAATRLRLQREAAKEMAG